MGWLMAKTLKDTHPGWKERGKGSNDYYLGVENLRTPSNPELLVKRPSPPPSLQQSCSNTSMPFKQIS